MRRVGYPGDVLTGQLGHNGETHLGNDGCLVLIESFPFILHGSFVIKQLYKQNKQTKHSYTIISNYLMQYNTVVERPGSMCLPNF